MKRLLIMFGLVLGVVGCATNPNAAKKIDTQLDKAAPVTGENIGVKNGNLVVQKKVEMNEELRRLQNEVYELEDHVYGNRKYGSEGLYGSLKQCRLKLVSKDYGGDGHLMWTEPLDRVTDKEDEWNVGIDENDKIVGVSEEFLRDRLKRFYGYKQVLMKRQDEYDEKLQICDAELASRMHDLKAKKAAADTPAQ